MSSKLDSKSRAVHVTNEQPEGGLKGGAFIEQSETRIYVLWDHSGVNDIAESYDATALKRWAKRNGYDVVSVSTYDNLNEHEWAAD